MSRPAIHRRLILACSAVAMFACPCVTPAAAQAKPRPRAAAAARPSRSIDVGGYAMVGRINFAAVESFDAILGEPSGSVFGGGARIGLPFGGLFVDVGAWRFRGDGERAFVAGGEVVPLGIPVAITITPIELSAGWRFRIPRVQRLMPYLAGGFTSMRYEETSEFATPAEDVDDTFSGYHVMGGAEYKITPWLGVAGEAAWSAVPDSIGQAGVSDAFNETDLGGTSFRFKITIGR